MSRARPAPATEAALLFASLVGAAALAHMVGGAWPRWPILAGAAAGAATTAAARRRLPTAAAVVLGALAVATTSTWAVLGPATIAGIATGRTWHRLATAVATAHTLIATTNPPYRPTDGIVLLGAATAGLAAVAARSLLGRTGQRPLAALSPAFALVALAGFAVGDPALAPAAALAVAGTVVLATTRTIGSPMRRADLLGAGVVGAAAAVAVAAGAAWAGPFGGYRPPPVHVGPGAGGDAVTGLSLVAGVDAVERTRSHLVVFTAITTEPTYWQVTTLDRFNGTDWLPSPSVQALLHGPLPAATRSRHGQQPTATVVIDAYSSRLLPVPTGTAAVIGLPGAEMTVGGAAAATAVVTGDSYTTFAATAATASGTPQAAPPTARSDLRLPPLPAVVTQLARQLTAGATTSRAKASRLVAWFRSGAFRYALDPPPTPTGVNPLVAFLTRTRAGSCQQFATAFAVLARAVGVPTRVAVGFAPGTATGGITTVTGADAHAWPEVYLGAGVGWTSYEPTPVLPTGAAVPPLVHTGSSASTGVSAPSVPSTTEPAPAGPSARQPVASQIRGTHVSGHRAARPAGAPTGAIAAAMALGLSGALWVVHRRRRRRRLGARPEQAVPRAWWEAEQALAGLGWVRPPGETPLRFATRLHHAAATGLDPPTDVAAAAAVEAATQTLQTLGRLQEDAVFGPDGPGPTTRHQAEAALRELRAALRAKEARRHLRSLADTARRDAPTDTRPWPTVPERPPVLR